MQWPLSQNDLLLRIESQFEDRGTKSAEASARSLVRELDKLERTERQLAAMQMQAARDDEARNLRRMQSTEQMGRSLLLVGAAAAVGMGIAAKAAMDWESAWAGVTKTVDGSAAQLANLEEQLRGLANTLPASHEEIAGVAEAAGQLGVKRQDIAAFTKTMVDLGVSTNLSSQDAATGLAKLGNVMGVLPSQADRAGAALVALGNDGASTEADILDMSLRIAGAGKTIGLTEAQVMGLASALSSVGIDAEMGGSAISRVMVDIAQAVDQGGESLDLFARVSGKTTADFSRMFRVDAAGALTAFIGGLGRVQASGQSVFSTLDQLGLGEIRVRDTLLRAAGASDLLAHSVQLGSEAWAENTALVNEANKRYETAESRVLRARNQLNNAAIDIGGTLLPALAGAANKVGVLAEGFAALPGDAKTAVTVIGGLATTLALAGGTAMMVVPKWAELQRTLMAMGPTAQAAGRGMGAITSILGGPWGLALAGAPLALGGFAMAQANARAAAKALSDTLDDQTGAITSATRKMATEKILENFSASDFRALEGKTKASIASIVDAALEGGKALADLDRQLAADQDYWSRGDQFDNAATSRIKALRNSLGSLGADMDGARAMSEKLREGIGGTGSSAQSATGKTDSLGRAIGDVSGAADRAQKELDDLLKAIEDYGAGALGARDATRGFYDSIDRAETALKENGHTLDVHTEKGRANQDALDGIASATLNMVTETFKGRDASEALAVSVATATEQVKQGREAFINAARAAGMQGAEAEALADKLGLTETNVRRLSTALDAVPKVTRADITTDTVGANQAIDAVEGRLTSLDRKTFVTTLDIQVPTWRIDLAANKLAALQSATGGGAWETGGYTGDIDPRAIAGVVHGREFVIDAENTARLGLPFLQALNSGATPLAPASVAPMPMAQQASLVGLELTGSLDTPWGPAQLRGVVQSEIQREADAYRRGRR